MNQAAIAFCLYWRAYLSQLNDFDRLYEEILVSFVECSEKDDYSLIFKLKDQLNEKKINDFSFEDICNSLSDVNLKIQGLKEIIYGTSNVFADSISFDKEQKSFVVISIIPAVAAINFNEEEFTKKFQKGTDCLWSYRFNYDIKNQINDYLTKNGNEKMNAQRAIYSDIYFAASMALACFYRRANNTKDGWQLLETIKKQNLFQEKSFFHHMHVRFEIYQICDYKSYNLTKSNSYNLIIMQHNDASDHVKKLIKNPDVEYHYDFNNDDYFHLINAGVFTHFPLCVKQAIEIGLITTDNSSNEIKEAIESLIKAYTYRPVFTSALGYCGILHYYNKEYELAKSRLQEAMRYESRQNSHHYRYYDMWNRFYYLTEMELSRKHSEIQYSETFEELKTARNHYIQLMALFVSVITIVVSFIMTLNKNDLDYNKLSADKNTIFFSPITDKVFLMFSLFSLVLATYFFLYFSLPYKQERKTNKKNIINNLLMYLLYSLGILLVFLIGASIFYYGRLLDNIYLKIIDPNNNKNFLIPFLKFISGAK